MSSKAIREYDAKLLLAYWLERAPPVDKNAIVATKFVYPSVKVAQIAWDPATGAITPDTKLPSWVFTSKLVAKPDQLIKRRGKAGLLALNKTWEEARPWIAERAGKPQKVEAITGTLNNFIVEPFLPHPSHTEYYVCINSAREGDQILFTHEGGVDIGDVDAKALRLDIPGDQILFTHEGGVDIGDVDAKALRLDIPVNAPFPSRDAVASALLTHVPAEKKDTLIDFLTRLYSVYVDLHFAYLEINPLICLDAENGGQPTIHYLDMAAKLDQTAESICGPKWAVARDLSVYEPAAAVAAKKGVSADRGPPMVWPAPFGRDLTKEEAYIQKLDASTGASLKLTVLNAEGRVWTMVAGGGASVVYSDAIAAHGFSHELANYGEYSGAPTEGQTYEYAKTIIDLITRGTPKPDGKILIIGGGIANFTNVAATFKGIIRALKEYKTPLINHKVRIFVRRGGPNYQEGLKAMRLLGESLGVPIKVYGPDTHITEIVPLALGIKGGSGKNEAHSVPPTAPGSPIARAVEVSDGNSALGTIQADGGRVQAEDNIVRFDSTDAHKRPDYRPFDADTRSFVYGLQPRAIQGMLDFDFSCGRETPSVAAMIYPFGGHHIQKFYWGTKETLLPVYTTVEEACKKHPEVDVIINFASSRSVYTSTLDAFKYPQIKSIALIAEGVPERHAREILHIAQEKGVLIIGPATVGGIKPGCFRIGNSGGMMDNIIASKLYRAGSVGYKLVSNGTIKPKAERDPPNIPMDYKWAQELGLIRKPAAFISTISDERGQELLYAGMRISDVFKEELGIGGVVSLLWFKRRLPPWATKFIEMVLMLTADHGPAVSGAMNTIVASRAGKDLISSLASGLLTIGSRFGGALDEAALILNVDGCIAVCFVDLLRDSGAFTSEEAEEYIKIGTLNGLFVLGRSIGFIGHHLDQKRLRAPLYRHPADDIYIEQASSQRVLAKV
ncbi:hypothetical protein HWV62_43084 [Athelia sp. TMB]|nr:hypothetical protein HWV62_43084 [Athelia sp. TMB]